MDNNQTNISRAETVANIVQIGINGVAGYYGGNTGKAFANFLTGNGAVLTSAGDLVDKINNGTATSKDISDVLQDMASIVAGFGFMAGYANPWVFSALFIVGVIKGTADYVDGHPELEQEIKDIFNNPANLKEWVDIWDFFNKEYNIDHTVNDLWQAFKNWVAPRRDPLVLDLDGDGIETLGITSTTQVLFDYDGDGVKTGTGWIKGDDGFVVLDRNGNGTIDNGGELFGDQTLVNGVKAVDGFAALSAEDTNHNGKFDAGDTNFTKVRIWQDTNSDGISQAGELHTLSELGVASVNLTSTTSNTVSNGNVQIAKGTFTKTNGDTGTSGTLNLTEDTGNAGNLNFSQNPFYSEFTNHLTLSDTALVRHSRPDRESSITSNHQNFNNTRRVA
jgi:hypothetical protein